MNSSRRKELKLFANTARKHILKSIHSAKSGHPGGSLSAAEYFTYLYNEVLRVDPKDPKNQDRDRFVLSKGHTAPGLYSVLAMRGFFPEEDLLTLRHIGSYLQGHPNMNETPGIDMTTGSLGQGISTAAGMAKGARFLGKDINVYSLLGDGEVEEGQVWEAMMFAAHYKLDNLCIAVDVNGLQIDGKTSDVMNSAPLDEKFAAFGASVIKINGNDFDDLEKAFDFFKANAGSGKPVVILMDTVKGKNVSFMENQAGWHGKAPSDEELAAALAELEEIEAAIEKED